MPGYLTQVFTVTVGARSFQLRALLDRQQFSDPTGAAEIAGISSATWCLFGQLWPAGLVLAQAMQTYILDKQRMLEIGCGLGLASMVLAARGAHVIASDHHPLAESFLAHNVALNALPLIPYLDLPWAQTQENLHPNAGLFDVIMAGDVLYERGHAELLAALIARHAQPLCEVLVTDPGRGHAARLSRLLAVQGFALVALRCRFQESDVKPFRGVLLRYTR
jgi:predicted nicotinamide N-methyase